MRKDIGATNVTDSEMACDMTSDLQNLLRDIHSPIVNSQVTISRFQSSP